MLKIYPVILELLRELKPRLEQVERNDADLARQMRRAMNSCALNTGEGMYSRGRNRKVRYHTALGSAREVLSVLEVADAMGYLPAVDQEMRKSLRSDHRDAGEARPVSRSRDA
jgi:four helix bundle protein